MILDFVTGRLSKSEEMLREGYAILAASAVEEAASYWFGRTIKLEA